MRDVLEKGKTAFAVAMGLGVPLTEVAQWIEDARADAQTAS